MSILVKGMELPTRCAVCVLCDLRYGTKCKITKMSYYDSEGYPRGGYNDRPEWCPLVEVKEPHGRLIDADRATAESIKRTGKRLLAIDLATTVVEAERGENHDD